MQLYAILALFDCNSIEHCDANSEQPPKEPTAGEYEVARKFSRLYKKYVCLLQE